MKINFFLKLFAIVCLSVGSLATADENSTTAGTTDVPVSDDDQALVEAVEQRRINAINKVIGSVIAIYDEDRQGGGSGVIIDPSGIALTNHHVIMGSGVAGWGGLADGKLYKWKLIGTDPGGDVSLIQMEGKDEFPFTPLGDSDQVRVGDWALAMGNPFILTEDQAPTVTLGIVSGVKRYQPGAGMNQLVYGNCIQVDSSINPGNSGGPLFNLNAEVIGINGRGSFKERGRVNVGLGYAISSNQIKNFIPDLMATKLIEHATLDASFSERNGKVVCSQLNLDAPVAEAGLKLGDELVTFEDIPIKNANQFTNLICTLPHDWPAKFVVLKPDGSELTIVSRCLGLPYMKPKVRNAPAGDGKGRDPEQEKRQKRQRQMVKLLSAPSNEIRFKDINKKYADRIIDDWQVRSGATKGPVAGAAILVDKWLNANDEPVGSQQLWLAGDGRIRIELQKGTQKEILVFDGDDFFAIKDGRTKQLTLIEAKLNLELSQAVAMSSVFTGDPCGQFGEALIAGADKAVGRNAFRFKLLDDEADHFFCWFSMYGDDGLPSTELLKVSAHKDCQENGGVTFSEWKKVGPINLPLRREFVLGLSETKQMTIANDSVEWVDEVVEDWFMVEKQKAVEEKPQPLEKPPLLDPDTLDPDDPFDQRNKTQDNGDRDKLTVVKNASSLHADDHSRGDKR